MSSVAWTWRTNTYAMWHMSSLSWRIASYMRKIKEFFCSLHHFLVYIFTGSIEPLETFLTNFGAMHLYLYSAYSYSIQSHLYSKLLYILQNLMHTLAQPPIFGQICCIFWSRPILPRQDWIAPVLGPTTQGQKWGMVFSRSWDHPFSLIIFSTESMTQEYLQVTYMYTCKMHVISKNPRVFCIWCTRYNEQRYTEPYFGQLYLGVGVLKEIFTLFDQLVQWGGQET